MQFFEIMKDSLTKGQEELEMGLRRSFRRRLIIKRFVVTSVVLVYLLIIMQLLWPTQIYISQVDLLPHMDDLFEPELLVDFPKGEMNSPKIPKIIHWTYKDEIIPPSFHANVKSFVDNNPEWTFYLWTDASAEKFITDTHPELLPTHQSYNKGAYSYIRKSDFIRYVVLYEMGGIYVDLDVIDFRPLDKLVSKYKCIFPTEPFEHAVLRAGAPYLINNAIMICNAKHPFLRTILDFLPRFAHLDDVNDSTGPAFVTSMYMIYNNISRDNGSRINETRQSNSPYFYKGKLQEDHDHAVYIPNSQYFCNNVDPKAYFQFYRICRNFNSLNNLKKRACANLALRGMERERNKYSFLEHQFYRTYGLYHFYIHWKIYIRLFSKDMREIVPRLQIYGDVS